MLQNAKVVMLPPKGNDKLSVYEYKSFTLIKVFGHAISNHELYITNDIDEIYEGDWFMNDDMIDNRYEFVQTNSVKIIATTDLKLGIPIIPENFVIRYADAANANKMLSDDVILDYCNDEETPIIINNKITLIPNWD